MNTPVKDRRKTTDWEKKSKRDANRINTRLQKRSEARPDKSITKDDAPPPASPKATGIPLLRLREKVKEIYHTPDNPSDNAPLFNIGLIEEDSPEEKALKRSAETIRIEKEQKLAGKLNLIMSTSLAAKKAGLDPTPTPQDSHLTQSAEYNLKKIRRLSLEEKIKKPLKLKGRIKEKDLSAAVAGIKNASSSLSPNALQDFPASSLPELAKKNKKEELAKLILKKSGRPEKTLPLNAKNQKKEQSKQDDDQQKQNP